MIPSKSLRRRRLGAGTLIVGAALMAFGYMAPSAQAADPAEAVFADEFDTYLNENQRGLEATDVENGEACPEDVLVDGMTAWHFVLQGASHDFETLSVAFSIDGGDVDMLDLTPKTTADWASFDPSMNFIADPDGKHAYVYTAGSGSVRDAAAHVTPDEAINKFQLSHVCIGEETSTDDGGTDDGGTDDTTTTDDVGGTTGTVDDGGTDDPTTTGGDTTGGTDDPTTTGDGTQVSGVQVVRAQVAGQQTLPVTGAEDRSLMLLGGALVLAGGASLLMRRGILNRA